MKRIVILGAGFGGVYTALNLLKKIRYDDPVEVILISKTNYFLFAPMLHEVATGGLNRSNIVEPIRTMLERGDTFTRATVESIDFTRQVVETGVGDLSYDVLVLALGSVTNFYDVPGAAEYSLTLKTLEDASRIHNRVLQAMECAARTEDTKECQRLLRWAIVGGGPTGVELAGEL